MTKSWYAVQVRADREAIARTLIDAHGYATFLPQYKTLRKWSDRRKKIERPLFPGYVFCQIPHSERNRVVALRPVIRIVGSGGAPEPIDEEEFAARKKALRR